jgi:MFS transporter, AAHS family, 4-hydroxybenzoate transporter
VMQLFQGGRGVGTVLLWIVFFMNLLDFYFLQSWLPTVLTDSGLATETAVLVSTLVSVGGIVCGILSGPLMDRFGSYFVLAGLYAMGTVFVALVGTTTSSLGAIVAVTFAAGFCVSGAQKSVNAAAVVFYPAAVRTTGVGWALGIGRLGSIVGPLAGGWLMSRGWSNAGIFQLMAIPMLCAAVVIFSMGLRYSTGSRQRAEVYS